MAEKTVRKENRFLRTVKGIGRFFRDAFGEMKKVVWPSRQTVLRNFLVVVVFVVICAVAIFLLDLLFSWVLGLLLNIGATPPA